MRKNILIAGALMALTPLAALALPAKPGIITMQQPDGSNIEVRMTGDESCHFVWGLDGTLLTLNAEGFYVPDSTPETTIAKRMEKKRDRGLYPNSYPSKGEQRAVVILVEFSDLGFTLENPNNYFRRMLNEEGFNDYGATGSVKEFYSFCSDGQLDIIFDVYGPVRLPNSYVFYGADYSPAGDDNAYKMILDACDKLDYEIDFTEYDRNNDGVIDTVYVIYAGYGQADGGGPLTIWPHSWEMSQADPRRVHTYDGKKLNIYSCLNELQTDRTSTDLKPQGIGPFIHEFTHVMGIPDLYATDGNPFCATPNLWSVMDLGTYNNDGRTPPYFSCYEQYAFDWIDPPALGAGDYVMKPYSDSRECYILNTTRQDEFFLIENRQQKGNDLYLPGHGLLVWHIDFDQDIWNTNQLNVNPNHQYVTLVKADNLYNLEDIAGDCFPGPAGNHELSCHREPYFIDWASKRVDFDLYDIEENEDGTVSFRSVACPLSSGVNSVGAGSAGVIVEGNAIRLAEGTAPVYDISGRKVGTATDRPLTLPAGIYVVSLPDSSEKIIIH